MSDSAVRPATTSNARWAHIDPVPFRKRAIRYRRIGSVAAAILLAFALTTLFVYTPTDLLTLLRFLALSAVFTIVLAVAMNASDSWNDRAKLAFLLNSYRLALDSEQKYILLLRSFWSELVSETTYQVCTVEREQRRMVRGELIPTGKMYTDYEHSGERVDDVRGFLVAAARNMHVVLIDGDTKSLALDPICILSPDNQWRDIFEELKEGAQLIVVVPETSASLIEEISRLMRVDAMNRCLFLMPPSVSVEHQTEHQGSWMSGMTRRERWAQCRAKLPITLPDYSEKGAILTFCNGSTLADSLPYSAETLANLLRERTSDGVSLAHAVARLRMKGLLSHTLSALQTRAKSLNA